MCTFKVKFATPYLGKIIGFCNISKFIALVCLKFKNKTSLHIEIRLDFQQVCELTFLAPHHG